MSLLRRASPIRGATPHTYLIIPQKVEHFDTLSWLIKATGLLAWSDILRRRAVHFQASEIFCTLAFTSCSLGHEHVWRLKVRLRENCFTVSFPLIPWPPLIPWVIRLDGQNRNRNVAHTINLRICERGHESYSTIQSGKLLQHSACDIMGE